MTANALAWRTSSYSSATDTNTCVEVAPTASATAVRDTTSRERGHLCVPAASWTTLVRTLKGERGR
ncbi:DUF397 domain-containing protein [Embleya scabrispora]|uniref:DUF397 domain-containing protein n=1 Tax=Embleya scabrispora TaxID=159449 RepID=UPI00099F1312|nr:DUF397 domain-containing protein [Embleya scabrispora]MYS84565.1 DUF397 domain-containing protein [Streptomyces sp. SID5474]